jgi:hypothetical protein
MHEQFSAFMMGEEPGMVLSGSDIYSAPSALKTSQGMRHLGRAGVVCKMKQTGSCVIHDETHRPSSFYQITRNAFYITAHL